MAFFRTAFGGFTDNVNNIRADELMPILIQNMSGSVGSLCDLSFILLAVFVGELLHTLKMDVGTALVSWGASAAHYAGRSP